MLMRGFSLLEVLIAMAISSVLLLGASRFLPALQLGVLQQMRQQALEEDPVDGDWVGCILVKDNKFYFGSYENQITGICLQQLRKVLGGNAK